MWVQDLQGSAAHMVIYEYKLDMCAHEKYSEKFVLAEETELLLFDFNLSTRNGVTIFSVYCLV